MKKNEFIQQLCQKFNYTPREADKVIQAFLDSIEDALAKDGKLLIRGFGSFTVKKRPAKKGRNPKTGRPIEIPAGKLILFHPGSNLKASLTN